MYPSEIIKSTYKLDHSHPNYQRWQRAIDAALLRGQLVCDIIAIYHSLKEAVVLDVGCGIGGTSLALHRNGADVISIDCDQARLEALRHLCPDIETEVLNVESLPYPDNSFDVVILQDILEHLVDPLAALDEVQRVLLPDGVVYLSTPNRLAITNIISDPHWGLPLLCLYKRVGIRRVLSKRRPSDANRNDIAQLFSYWELCRLLQNTGFSAIFTNRIMTDALFNNPRAVIWSDLHLLIAKGIATFRLNNLAKKVVSDRPGFFNSFINPTWYMICKKMTVSSIRG